MSQYTVGDMVAEFLSRIGVTTCFGIISVHNIPTLDAIGRRNAIRYVMCRGEMGGAHMADAYARVSGHLGVLFSSTGPGMANTVGGLVEAQFAGSPVLHITGQTMTKYIDRDMGTVHDVPGQLDILRASGKAAYRVRSADQALGVLIQAATEALTPPKGPVSVEIPVDIQRTPIKRPALLDSLELPLPPPPPPAESELEDAIAILAKAKRPMVWLGNGAKGAGKEAMALLELGFGAVTSWNGRGIIPEDHPMTFGGLQGNGSPRVEEFYQGVDVMLVVGSKLRGHETIDFSLKLPKTIIHVDVDPRANGRTYANSAFIHGDAALTMRAIADRLRGRIQVDPNFAAEFQDTKRRAIADYCATLGPYAEFPALLRSVLPRDTVWVRDITISNSTWGNRIFPIYDPKDAVHPVGAAIGPGVPLGVGAAMAAGHGRKTVAMCGDGGFAMNQTELWSAVQERAELIVMVMNDKGYGVIKHIQNATQEGRNFYGDLQGPDLLKLAEVAGLPAWRVSRIEDLVPTMQKALATPGPVLLDIDMVSIGAFPPYAPYNTMGIYAKK